MNDITKEELIQFLKENMEVRLSVYQNYDAGSFYVKILIGEEEIAEDFISLSDFDL